MGRKIAREGILGAATSPSRPQRRDAKTTRRRPAQYRHIVVDALPGPGQHHTSWLESQVSTPPQRMSIRPGPSRPSGRCLIRRRLLLPFAVGLLSGEIHLCPGPGWSRPREIQGRCGN